MNAKKRSLRHTVQRVRTVPGLGRDVSALVAVIVLGLIATGVILSQMNYTWPWDDDRFSFKIEFSEAVAVNPGKGQEVRIAGVRVGDIQDAEPTGNHTSLVTVSIDKGHPVYDNARAILRPKNPLNEMYIELNTGGPPGRQLPPNGVLQSGQTERPVQAEEVLNHLDARSRSAVTALLNESDVALAGAQKSLPAGLNSTDATLTKLKPVMESLATRREHIRQLVTAISQLAGAAGSNDERLTSLVDSAQQTLGELASRDDEIGAALDKLPGVSHQLNHAMSSTRQLTGQLNPLLDNVKQASGELPSTLHRLRSTVGNLDRTVRAAEPTVGKARPVVAGLKPVAKDLAGTFGALKPTTARLGYATAQVAPWMYDLGAFVYNTNSLFSISDVNGGYGRGHATVDLRSPTGLQSSDEKTSNTYRQGGSPLGPYPAPGRGG